MIFCLRNWCRLYSPVVVNGHIYIRSSKLNTGVAKICKTTQTTVWARLFLTGLKTFLVKTDNILDFYWQVYLLNIDKTIFQKLFHMLIMNCRQSFGTSYLLSYTQTYQKLLRIFHKHKWKELHLIDSCVKFCVLIEAESFKGWSLPFCS